MLSEMPDISIPLGSVAPAHRTNYSGDVEERTALLRGHVPVDDDDPGIGRRHGCALIVPVWSDAQYWSHPVLEFVGYSVHILKALSTPKRLKQSCVYVDLDLGSSAQVIVTIANRVGEERFNHFLLPNGRLRTRYWLRPRANRYCISSYYNGNLPPEVPSWMKMIATMLRIQPGEYMRTPSGHLQSDHIPPPVMPVYTSPYSTYSPDVEWRPWCDHGTPLFLGDLPYIKINWTSASDTVSLRWLARNHYLPVSTLLEPFNDYRESSYPDEYYLPVPQHLSYVCYTRPEKHLKESMPAKTMTRRTRRSRRRAQQPGPSNGPVAAQTSANLTWTGVAMIRITTTGTPSFTGLWGNTPIGYIALQNIFDPTVGSIVTDLPSTGADEWAKFYRRYRVDSVRCTVMVSPTYVPSTAAAYSPPYLNITTGSAPDSTGFTESGSFSRLVPAAGTKDITYVRTHSPAKILGVSPQVFKSDNVYQTDAAVGAGPTRQSYLKLGLGGANLLGPSTTALDVAQCMIKLDYRVVFFEPKQLPVSK